MKDAALLAAVTALGLGLVAAIVVAGGDTRTFVPPPESVSENFVRSMTTGRYDRALKYVDPGAAISGNVVRREAERLRERGGAVNHVEGEPGTIRGDTATAAVVVRTERAGDLRLTFSLVRKHHEWRIDAFNGGF
jgi:hypothetical protein